MRSQDYKKIPTWEDIFISSENIDMRAVNEGNHSVFSHEVSGPTKNSQKESELNGLGQNSESIVMASTLVGGAPN